MSPWFLQAEPANKVATVSPGSGQAQVPEEAVAISSPALASAKSATQPHGPSAPRYV